jgi:hypothetical protein
MHSLCHDETKDNIEDEYSHDQSINSMVSASLENTPAQQWSDQATSVQGDTNPARSLANVRGSDCVSERSHPGNPDNGAS